MVKKRGPKNSGRPPPLIRAMPERKRFFSTDVFPKTIKLKMAIKNEDKGHLGQLDVSVDEVRKVWEIEAKGELLVKPARLVKVRS